MKKYLVILLLPIIIVALSGAGVLKINDGWKIFETADYSLQYPSDWKLDTTSKSSKRTIYILSPKAAAGDKFAERVSLLAQDVHRELTLEYVVPQMESMFDTTKSKWITARLKQSVRKKSNGREYQEMIITNGTLDTKLKMVNRVFTNKNMVYTIGFSSPQATFDETIKTGERILDSFHLK